MTLPSDRVMKRIAARINGADYYGSRVKGAFLNFVYACVMIILCIG